MFPIFKHGLLGAWSSKNDSSNIPTSVALNVGTIASGNIWVCTDGTIVRAPGGKLTTGGRDQISKVAMIRGHAIHRHKMTVSSTNIGQERMVRSCSIVDILSGVCRKTRHRYWVKERSKPTRSTNAKALARTTDIVVAYIWRNGAEGPSAGLPDKCKQKMPCTTAIAKASLGISNAYAT